MNSLVYALLAQLEAGSNLRSHLQMEAQSKYHGRGMIRVFSQGGEEMHFEDAGGTMIASRQLSLMYFSNRIRNSGRC